MYHIGTPPCKIYSAWTWRILQGGQPDLTSHQQQELEALYNHGSEVSERFVAVIALQKFGFTYTVYTLALRDANSCECMIVY